MSIKGGNQSQTVNSQWDLCALGSRPSFPINHRTWGNLDPLCEVSPKRPPSHGGEMRLEPHLGVAWNKELILVHREWAGHVHLCFYQQLCLPS